LNNKINPEYLLYAIELKKDEENFNRSFRASLANIKEFAVKIPISSDGTFDVTVQDKIAERFVITQQKRDKLLQIKSQLNNITERYLS
jgi:hypothetical protein